MSDRTNINVLQNIVPYEHVDSSITLNKSLNNIIPKEIDPATLVNDGPDIPGSIDQFARVSTDVFANSGYI
jgi:hypothetical protein